MRFEIINQYALRGDRNRNTCNLAASSLGASSHNRDPADTDFLSFALWRSHPGVARRRVAGLLRRRKVLLLLWLWLLLLLLLVPVLGVLAVVGVGGIVVVLRKGRVAVACDRGVGGGRAAVLLLLAVHLSVDRLAGSYLRRIDEKGYEKGPSDTRGGLGFRAC